MRCTDADAFLRFLFPGSPETEQTGIQELHPFKTDYGSGTARTVSQLYDTLFLQAAFHGAGSRHHTEPVHILHFSLAFQFSPEFSHRQTLSYAEAVYGQHHQLAVLYRNRRSHIGHIPFRTSQYGMHHCLDRLVPDICIPARRKTCKVVQESRQAV